MSRTVINSQKPILNTKLFSVDALEVEFGKMHDTFYGITVKPAVNILPLGDDNSITMIRNYRHFHDESFIELVSGMIENDESPLSAGKRELREEAGLIAASWNNIGKFDLASGIMKWPLYYYVAKQLTEKKQKLDDSEDIDIVTMPFETAVE